MAERRERETERPAAPMSRRDALRLIGAAPLVLTMTGSGGPGPGPLAARPIPASGERIPVIGLGTWETFDAGGPGALGPLRAVLAAFAEGGGRFVDSSPMYGRAESVLGELVERLGIRASLFLADKVWTSGRAAGVAQMKESLRRLRTPSIDLMQVHNLVDVEEQLATLREWKRRGVVRHVGITHYLASAHADVERLLRNERVDFLQINYSVLEPEAGDRLIPLAADRGVAVVANRPFAGGDFFRATHSLPLPGWAAPIGCRTWAQAALKWILGNPAVTVAIPATDRLDHLADNLSAGRPPFPDPALRRSIAATLATR